MQCSIFISCKELRLLSHSLKLNNRYLDIVESTRDSASVADASPPLICKKRNSALVKIPASRLYSPTEISDSIHLFPEIRQNIKNYNNSIISERVNVRIINDFHQHQISNYWRKRYIFFAILTGINIFQTPD